LMVILPFVGWLLGKIEPRWLVTFGALVIAASLLYMGHFDLDLDFHTAMMARVYQSCGMAFLFVPINVMAFYFISKEKINNATGIINLARNMGGSVGISAVQTLLARRQQFHQNYLAADATPFSNSYRSALSGMTQMFSSHTSSTVEASAQARGLMYEIIGRQSMMQAFVDIFRMLAGISLAIVPMMFLMKKIRPTKSPTPGMH